MAQQLADILKTLDLELEVDDEAIVTDVLVLAKVQRLDGATTVLRCTTEGTDWITAVGMTTVAHAGVMRDLKDYDS